MQVSVESKDGLERKLSVTLPAEQYNEAVEKRLSQIARTAKISGFRPGKVPMKVVKQQYGAQANHEALSDVIQGSIAQAVAQEKLNPAGYPSVESTDISESGEVSYTATVEVYPEVKLSDFSKLKIERIKSELSDSDVDDMVKTLQEQRAEWKPVKRKSKKGEQVKIDFLGKIDGEAFDGGKGENMDLVLGEGRMISGFEDEIIGMKTGEEKVINVTFPEDYGKDDLNGKAATFDIKVHEVAERVLPEMDEEFFKAFGAKDEAELRDNLKQHMTRELEQKLKAANKQAVMDALLGAHSFDVPSALVAQEVQQLKQQAFQQFGGQAPIKFEDVPDEPFQEDAKRRVQLGLLLGEIIDENKLEADEDSVKAAIASLAGGYEKPDDVIKHYYDNPQLLNNIRSLVIEEKSVDLVLGQAKVTETEKSFNNLMQQQPA